MYIYNNSHILFKVMLVIKYWGEEGSLRLDLETEYLSPHS